MELSSMPALLNLLYYARVNGVAGYILFSRVPQACQLFGRSKDVAIGWLDFTFGNMFWLGLCLANPSFVPVESVSVRSQTLLQTLLVPVNILSIPVLIFCVPGNYLCVRGLIMCTLYLTCTCVYEYCACPHVNPVAVYMLFCLLTCMPLFITLCESSLCVAVFPECVCVGTCLG